MPRSVRRPMLIGSASPGGRRVIRPDCSSVPRQQLHHRQRGGRLPAARLAGEPERLARLELQVDPVDDRVVAVGDPQVLDLEQRAHRSSRSRGLTNSSNR